MATRRAEMTQESRRLLLTAATELFAERGYRQTSFAEIAERSGISRGSIPWHFDNKLGLLEAVVDDQLHSAMTGFTPPKGQGIAALEDLLDQTADFIRLPTTRLFIALLAEANEAGSPIHEHYARMHTTLRQTMQPWVPTAALPAGVTPESFVVFLLGTIFGIHVQWRITPDDIDLDAACATLRTVVSTFLASPDESL